MDTYVLMFLVGLSLKSDYFRIEIRKSPVDGPFIAEAKIRLF